MIKRLKSFSLLKTASVYTMSNILNALIPFFLMPVLTRYLTPVDYGITSMMQVMIGFLNPFVGLNLHGAIAVKYYKKDEIDFPKYVSSCFIILCGSSLGMIMLFICFSQQISELTSFPLDWIWSILLICFGQFLINIVLTILQVSVRPRFYACIQISQTLINLGLSLWLIIILSFNWQGRVIAQVLTVSVFMIIGLFLLIRWKLLIFSYDSNYIKDALKFGIPLIPHALSGYFLSMSDRFFITNLVGIEATGLYAVGAQIGMAIQLLAGSFNQAYSPWLFRNLSQVTETIKRKIVKITYIYFFIIFVIAVSYSLIMPYFLQYFLGEKFVNSRDYVFGIALAGAFQGMYFMVVNYIFYVGKTYILACITFSMGIVHIFNTYWAVTWLGTIGATYASALTAFCTFILVWILSNKVYPMPWLTKK